MPSSPAEELSEPLLPAENSRENEGIEEEEPEAVPNDEEEALIEEERPTRRRVVERTRSTSAQPPPATRPSGPCYLVKELFYLVLYLIHRPIFSDPASDHPFRVQVRYIKFLVVTLLGISATHMVVLAFVSEKITNVLGAFLSVLCAAPGPF